MSQQILIIGAGAVGLVYGKHFSDAGHSVTFYVREKYIDDLSNGSVLYHINKDKKLNQSIQYKNYELVSSFEEVGQKKYDQIYLSFSSTALMKFDFKGFKENLKGNPTIVMLHPSKSDYDILNQTFPADQIVQGMITLISYQAPLVTEQADPPGIAYYLPPMMPTPVSGPNERAKEVVSLFKDGKMAAKVNKSVEMEALFPTAFLSSFLIGLEASDWKFKKMKKDKHLLSILKQSVDEVMTALETQYKVKRPMPMKLVNSRRMTKLLLTLAPKVMPMDIETYFEYHFKKVNDQTKMYVNNYMELAKSTGNKYKSIESLLAKASNSKI